ncbi:MAG: exosome complex protein Rrp4 [Methanobrevibacter sp.]|nr:exosome complex protein Rrp4 [Methanobrevibacter sp.]
MIYVENKDLVIPGQVLADDEYYSGRGTFKENGKVCSSLMGLVSLRNKKIRVIPLKSKYVPKKGDVVIGKINDVRFSMWDVDINSPYSGILPAFEVFGREKKELNKVYDVGDVLFLRVVDVDEIKKAKLGLKGRGMGKFKGGIIVDIAPTKVPRLIGKKGSMINMIKDKTNCKIVVGQNGLVWVKGDEDMEQLTKDVIHLIEAEAHTSGLTNKIKNKLYLAIDGEIPPEEVPEEEEEFVLEKPKLQNFKEELEQEEKEAEEEKQEEQEEKPGDDEEEKEDKPGDDEEEKEDKPNIAEVIEELKRKNKKDNTFSYGESSMNSFILNNKK